MRRLDLNELKQEYIGKTFSWLTVIDVFRNEQSVITFKCKCRCGNVTCTRKQYILSGHTTSCGCYKKSKEKSTKYIEWCKNNPDKIKEKTEKRSKTLEENPTILVNASKKQQQFWKDNPDKLADRGRKRSEWSKDNADRSYLESYKDVIHPDDYAQLINGETLYNVRIKCRLCGEYDIHTFSNVFCTRAHGLKPGRDIPLCKQCRSVNYSSSVENEIADFISTFYSEQPLRNSREIISPLELDLYYPEKKIAIEFNGDYWHSDLFKTPDYHYNKFRICVDNDIVLVSIFESRWCENSTVIKQYLIDLFNGKQNNLSFDKRGYMNNNYPSFGCILSIERITDSYSFRDNLVTTCGYTKLK